MPTLNVEVDGYSNKVLDVVKAIHGLSNKSEALNLIVHEYGPKILEPELKKEAIEKVLRITKNWEAKHPFKRKMSLDQLDSL